MRPRPDAAGDGEEHKAHDCEGGLLGAEPAALDADGRALLHDRRAEERPVERADEPLGRRFLRVVCHRDSTEHEVHLDVAYARHRAELPLDEVDLARAAEAGDLDLGDRWGGVVDH